MIGALVTHIGSGYGPEVEAAFIALESLVNEQTNKMASFTIFLKVFTSEVDPFPDSLSMYFYYKWKQNL